MTREDFKTLLTDIYQIYNPAKIKDIDFTINKYNGREFDAIKTAFIFYNNKFHPDFNPELNTDKYISNLIEKYSNNERALAKDVSKRKALEQELSVQKQKEEEEKLRQQKSEQENLINEKLKQEGQNIKTEIQKAVDEKVNEYFSQRKQEIDKQLEETFKKESKRIEEYFKSKLENIPELINKITENKIKDVSIKNQEDKKVEIKITNLNFGDSDLIMPGEEVMKNVCIGQRMVVYDSNKNICGLEIKDITDDNVSFEGLCVRDISIMKIE